jgi:hypothetical protein
MTKIDNKIPSLDNIHIRKDGSTIGTNGIAVIAVSPVNKKFSDHAVFDKDKIKGLDLSYTISAESIRDVLKVLPNDSKFGGVLELVNFNGNEVEIHDGKRKKSIEMKKYNREYIPYQDVFKEAYKTAKEQGMVQTAINLNRLLSVIESLKEICNDSTQNTILFIQFTKRGDIIFRTQNKYGQRIVSIVKAYDNVEGSIPAFTDWENDLFGVLGGQSVDYSKEIHKAYDGGNGGNGGNGGKRKKIEKIKLTRA